MRAGPARCDAVTDHVATHDERDLQRPDRSASSRGFKLLGD
jgi:hypothetical protein